MRQLSRGIYAFALLCAFVLIFSNCKKNKDEEPLVITPTVNPAPYSLQVYLLTPNDQTFNPDYYRAARNTTLDLQKWYKAQMGGKTFELNPVVVDTITGSHNSTWYTSNNGEVSNNSPSGFFNTRSDMKELLGSKYDTALYTYLVWTTVPFPDETIPKGIAVESSTNLDGLVGSGPNMWMGAAGHALGHAFGLPEVAVENQDGIMSHGWPKYPNCVLKPFEIDSLNNSLFFKVQ
jgi:hypothetical protein